MDAGNAAGQDAHAASAQEVTRGRARRSVRATVRGRPRGRLHRHPRGGQRHDARRQSPPEADLRLPAGDRRAPGAAVRRRRASSTLRRAPRFSTELDKHGAVADYLLRLRRPTARRCGSKSPPPRDPSGRQATTGALRDRGAGPRRQRAQEARRSVARRPLPAAAGREDGRARPDHLGRRARAEQPARHDPVVGRAAGGAARARRQDQARARGHPQRIRTRRPHRPQPADLRPQAADHARDGRPQPGRARDARPARLRAARDQHRGGRGARRPACRTCSPTAIRSSRCC